MGLSKIGLRGVQGQFYGRFEAVTAAAWQGLIAATIKTDQELEDYASLTHSPMMREWIGGRQVKGVSENSLRVVNKLFEATIGLSVDDLRRDKTGQIRIRIADLADRAGDHPHQLLSALIESPGNCYDGTAFFGTAHAEGASGTQINALTNSHVAKLDIATAAAPTAAEMVDGVMGVVEKILAFKDDQGHPMNHNAKEFAVMVPANMWAATATAFALPQILASGQPALNPLVTLDGYKFRPIVNPRLTSTTVFYVFRTDSAGKPFIFQEELFETGEEDQTFTNNRVLFGVKALRNVGPLFWQYAAKATFN